MAAPRAATPSPHTCGRTLTPPHPQGGDTAAEKEVAPPRPPHAPPVPGPAGGGRRPTQDSPRDLGVPRPRPTPPRPFGLASGVLETARWGAGTEVHESLSPPSVPGSGSLCPLHLSPDAGASVPSICPQEQPGQPGAATPPGTCQTKECEKSERGRSPYPKLRGPEWNVEWTDTVPGGLRYFPPPSCPVRDILGSPSGSVSSGS